MENRRKERLRLAATKAWVAVSLLTSAATLLAFGASWWWPLDLLSHFRVQYIWMLAPLTIGLLAGKRHSAACLAGCCLIWNGVLVAPDYLGSTAATSGGDPFRLMSVNVRTGNRDYQRFLQTVRAADPDVLLVMEIDDGWLGALEQLRGEFPHGESAPRPDNFGIALFSKLPLEALRLHRLTSAGVPSIQVSLKLGDDTVHVLGMHTLPPMGRRRWTVRNEQLAAAADLAAGLQGPVVLAGDLNITPWSPFFQKLLDRSGLRDTRRGLGVQATWPSRWGIAGIPIDHVLVSEELTVSGRQVGPAFGSDHRPVVADLIVRRQR